MRVLFLALGRTRPRAVVGESADLVAAGHRVVVLVEEAAAWRRHGLVRGVRVLELAQLRPEHLPRPFARSLLLTYPDSLFAALARGPLAGRVRRVQRAYWAGVTRRIRAGSHLFTPHPGNDPEADVPDEIWQDARRLLIRYHVLRGARFDLLVIADPASIPEAAHLVGPALGGPVAAAFAYSSDNVVPVGAEERACEPRRPDSAGPAGVAPGERTAA